jgi:hypothetical protein
MGFQFFNPTQIGPANSSGSRAVTNITSSAVSESLNSQNCGALWPPESLVVAGTVDVNTPSGAVSASASQVTSSSGLLFTNTDPNNFTLGLKVQFTTSNALPTGISALTDYFVVPVTANTYRVATSLANALAGTVVAYTNTGTGNQTATPVAIAGGTGKLQGSNDQEVTWADVPNASYSITADGSFVIEIDYIRYAAYRWVTDLTAGQVQYTKLQFGYKGGN